MNTERLYVRTIDEPEEDCLQIADLFQFTLLDDESRRAFLFAFYWIGESALFAAVSHVWERLAEPRDWRCTQMGQLSGTGGEGESALLLILQKFLNEALASISALPEQADFASLEAWHAAAMHSFATDEARARDVCRAYAQILDGGENDELAARVNGPGPTGRPSLNRTDRP